MRLCAREQLGQQAGIDEAIASYQQDIVGSLAKPLEVLWKIVPIRGYSVQYRIVRQTRRLDSHGYGADTIEVKDTHTALVEFFDMAAS